MPIPTGNNIRARAPIGGGQRQPAGNQGGGIRPAGAAAQQPRGGGIQPQGRAPQNNGYQQNGRQQGGQQQPPREAGGIQGVDNIRQQQQRQTQIEQRRAQERADGYQPLRFYLPDPQPKNKAWPQPHELEANIIILDHEPSFAVYEHTFPNPQTGRMGKGSFNQLCLSQEGHCPACDADTKDPYFALFLSVIDMRGYTKDDGTHIPHSKKLLVIKNKNQDWFFRKFDQYGTLRGMQLLMIRNDPRGANHGNPDFIELHPEEAILDAFQHPRVMSQDNTRVIKEANADCYPYDYAVTFPKPDYNQMLEKFGGAPAAGSAHDQQSTWGADAGQFNQAQSRGPQGGARRTGGIGLASSANRPQNDMRGNGQEEGDYDDDGTGQSALGREMDDEIPFSGGQVRGRGQDADGAATDPDQIPL